MTAWAFKREVSLAVLTRAKTEADHHEDLGCSILGPSSRPVRTAHAWLKRTVQRLGKAEALGQARTLVAAMEATNAYRRLSTGKRRRGRLELRHDVLFPDPRRTPPRVLHVRHGELAFDLDVPAGAWPAIADLCAALGRGLARSERQLFARTPVASELLATLQEARWLEPIGERPTLPPTGSVFVGHNTTLVREGGASVLIDPYFRPSSAIDLPTYPPMHARDLGTVGAVCITHSHGDHFHLGSLLTLPRDTAVFVPRVERESLFSTDCALRLEQLGFTNVQAMAWHSSRRVGALSVHALPFYGEQPTSGDGLYPGLFNEGATWVVRGPSSSAAFFADSGTDVRGSMADVCSLAVRGGPIDTLFCGVRGFQLEPIFFGFSTLDAFLVNVPLDLLTAPQRLMADAREALDFAKRLGARTLVPCADGGAPWYWREGMGPKYPGFPGAPVEGASTMDENPDADPYPERVLEARRPGDVRVEVLRPGSALTALGATPLEGFRWPFEPLAAPSRHHAEAR